MSDQHPAASPVGSRAQSPMLPGGGAGSSVTSTMAPAGSSTEKSPGSMMRLVNKAGKAASHAKKAAKRVRRSVNPLRLAAAKGDSQRRQALTGASGSSQAEIARAASAAGSGAASLQPPQPPRELPLNAGISPPAPGGGKYCTNAVGTAKYNPITFLPKFLFEMFSRVAYLYFLFQALLSWWPEVSPFGGWGSTLALLFVLLVGAVKALFEDGKRHKEDRATNRSIAHQVQPDGSIKDVHWTHVQVGNLIMVKDDELFPADLLCLYADNPDNVCFIKTTNLDGETNLKIKRPLELRGIELDGTQAALALRGKLTVEPPSADLHMLKGKFQYSGEGEDRQVAVTMNEMLLRGCMLKNSRYVVGMVVYTGPESRIQMNSAEVPLKVGSFDRFLNIMISLVILMQIILCIWHSVANCIWRSNVGYDRYYLALNIYVNGNYSSPFVYWVIQMLTFWLLYSYLVPISLFVTMELVKFWQGFVFINRDLEMRDEESGESARCRNSGLNEDLGKVEYIFSDKTGTLTANEMQLRMLSVKGTVMGKPDWRIEQHPDMPSSECIRTYDPAMADAVAELAADKQRWAAALQSGGSDAALLRATGSVQDLQQLGHTEKEMLGAQVLDFWTNICVCHSLIVEDNPKEGGKPIYQGPSPDEVALVEAARQLGFEFVSRGVGDVTVSMQGSIVKYEILNLQEFTSARGCMSVVARAPDGTIRLFCKGADAKVLPRLRTDTDAALLDKTNKDLHLFATRGLRTLLLGTRVLSEAEYDSWDERYQDAASDLDNREGRIAELADEVEQGLELVGVSAIEDKLQDGVPEAIASLLDAGIKVWMITGDKQETAINIGVSCKLVRNPDSLLICNGDSYEEAKEKLESLLGSIDALGRESAAAGGIAMVGELVIDGKTLTHVLKASDLRGYLAEIGSKCNSVVVCRASPSQKADIVKLMTEYEMQLASGNSTGLFRWWKRYDKRMKGKMLAIGDGANDVAMIQAADIGVGIMGKEGRQAVNNSDYAFAQFRFLVRLLLVHGTLSHYRLARLIKYSFYKNVAFNFVLFWFQFYCGYSGTTLIDGIPATAYNVVFTSLPILFYALLDRPVKYLSTLMRYPGMYNKQHSLTILGFLYGSIWVAFVDGTVIFFVCYYALTSAGQQSVTDLFSLGKAVFLGLMGVVTLEILLIARFWTWVFLFFVWLSYLVAYVFFLLYPLVELWMNVYDPSWYGQPYQVLSTGYFWFSMLTVYAMCFGYRYVQRTFLWLYQPQDTMVLSEMEKLGGPLGGTMSWRMTKRMTTLMRRRDDIGGFDGDGPNSFAAGDVPATPDKIISVSPSAAAGVAGSANGGIDDETTPGMSQKALRGDLPLSA